MPGPTWLRRSLVASGCLLAIVVATCVAAERYRQRDFLSDFQERRNRLAGVQESVLEERPEATILHLGLTGDRGIEVEAHVKVPHRGEPPFPVMITLGGIGTGRRTIDYLGDTGSWIVVGLDYPYHGSRESVGILRFLAGLPEMRRAMLDTVPAGMLALDYLWRRPDVDRSRVVLAGGSLGALFSPALAAAEERIRALMILFGAGDLPALIDANLDLRWPLQPLAVWLGGLLVSPLEPLEYIGRVAPRPVFLLSGTDDEAMPERCTRSLHDQAREPKTVRWLDVGHVNIRDEAFHRQVLRECVAWLRDIGFMGREETFSPPVGPADCQQ